MARHGRTTTSMRRRSLAAFVSLILAAGALVPATAAAAAPQARAGSNSSGDLTVSVEWVDSALVPISELQGTASSQGNVSERLVGLNVGYACGPVTCTGASVFIAPMELDPFYGAYRFALFDSATLPAGATRTGNNNIGYTINLGTLVPGSSGAFTVTYNYQNRQLFPAPQSFFPEGDQVTASVTMSAAGMAGVTATDDVTWHIQTADPDVAFFPASQAPTGVLAPARVDTDYSYTLYMTSGCYWSGGGHGEPMYECAAAYNARHTLPAGVEFVSASNGGSFDPGTRTVSWTESGQAAATGWGAMTISGSPRTVVVRYPSTMITDPANCLLSLDTTLSVDVTYLSGATRSASTTKPQAINGCVPFAAGSADKSSTSSFATGSAESVAWAGSTQQWVVRVYNRSNVPARGTITDTFGQAGLPVTRIQSLQGVADITATLDNGQVVTTSVADYTAPVGRRIVSATVVTPEILGPNTHVGDQSAQNVATVRFHYTVESPVPSDGFTRTNTAHVNLSFPSNPELGVLNAGNRSASVLVTPQPAQFAPTLTASAAGGGNPVPGTVVTFTGGGTMSQQDAGVDFRPQYVFVAPAGWTIDTGSVSIAGVSGITPEFRTVTVDGVARQAVFVQRTDVVSWGINQTWPALSVQATPGTGLPANTNSTANFYMGDAQHNYGARSAIWGAQSGNAWGSYRYVDSADLDADGVTTESFAYAERTLRIGAASGLNVLKEICVPDASQPDGCAWSSDPDHPVAVAPDTTNVQYRITITNTGTSALSSVVGYDVLPHPGDTGLTPATASTPRGSTFAQRVSGTSLPPSITVDSSFSTNPCRTEVYPAAPGCDAAWSPGTVVGASALRINVQGTLAGGDSVSLVYSASTVGVPPAGALACNSVAVASATTPATDPRPVCAEIASADLEASSPATLPTQLGRPATVPFLFSHLLGTDGVPATARIAIPAGIEVTNLVLGGWNCVSSAPAPVAGPADVDCTPTAPLGLGDDLELRLPIVVGVSSASITATISSSVFDPDATNNSTTVALDVAVPIPSGIEVAKSDGVVAARTGDELTYVITVTNQLLFEPLADVEVLDTLPAELVFVSATDGGTESAGVVTWMLPSIAAGATVSVEVTVRLADTARGTVTNQVTATTLDPAFATVLSASAADADLVIDDAAELALTGLGITGAWMGLGALVLGLALLLTRARRRSA
jgi:uncharacterized repeat protein (TIGR01451 family)